MITVRFQGGLGNQMFQYCIYKKYQNQGKKVRADLFYYSNHNVMPFVLEKVFPNIILERSKDRGQYFAVVNNIQKRSLNKIWDCFKIIVSPNKVKYYYEIREGYFNKFIFKIKSGYVEGFWQSEKYFEDIQNDIRNQFIFKSITDKQIIYYKDIIEKNNSISIHVRRGDYLLEENQKMFGRICTEGYYEKAIQHMKLLLENIQFIVFSDDMLWVKNNIKGLQGAIFIESNGIEKYEDWYDMYLMSKCKHNIIANSTFSWWGAWLNQNENKIVIAPNEWIKRKKMPHVIVKDWIKVKGE